MNHMRKIDNAHEYFPKELSTFNPYCNVDRRPEVIWELVQVERDGHNSVTIKYLCSWQGKLRRMLAGFSKASGGEGRLKGNSANTERL